MTNRTTLAPCSLPDHREQYRAPSLGGDGYARETLAWVRDRAPEAAPWHPRAGYLLERVRYDHGGAWRVRFVVGALAWDDVQGWHATEGGTAYDLPSDAAAMTDETLRALGVAGYLATLDALPGMLAALPAARAAHTERRRQRRAGERARTACPRGWSE